MYERDTDLHLHAASKASTQKQSRDMRGFPVFALCASLLADTGGAGSVRAAWRVLGWIAIARHQTLCQLAQLRAQSHGVDGVGRVAREGEIDPAGHFVGFDDDQTLGRYRQAVAGAEPVIVQFTLDRDPDPAADNTQAAGLVGNARDGLAGVDADASFCE